MNQNAMKAAAAITVIISCSDPATNEVETQTVEVADVARIDRVAAAHQRLFAAYRDMPVENVACGVTRLA